MTPIGTFDIKSEKTFRYRKQLSELIANERELAESDPILSIIIKNGKRSVDFTWRITEVHTNRISFFLDFVDAGAVS